MRTALAAAGLGLLLAGTVSAQQIVLKLHHPLPPNSTAQTRVLGPWCERIEAESRQRLKCQIYPAMQLGGIPTQLYDQAKDGVADLIWTVPTWSASRFPLVEVFELPFMMRQAEGTSLALWEYVQQHAASDFKDVKTLALHVHGGGSFHTVKKPVGRMSDLQGLKIRAPTKETTKLLSALGATPVAMPVPQVPEALSKGVIDGALLPYEVMPAIKAIEITRYHSEVDASEPMIYTSVFVFAMNKARYDTLPADLRAVIDANSGAALSAQIGRIYGEAEVTNRKLVPPQSITVISREEVARWKLAAQPVIDGWVKDVTARGADGKGLLEKARALIAKHER